MYRMSPEMEVADKPQWVDCFLPCRCRANIAKLVTCFDCCWKDSVRATVSKNLAAVAVAAGGGG
jgi:hypothetical protein